jgi:neurofibromin 1
MEAKSALFLKYFTLFMNLLNDCSEAGNEDKESGVRVKHSISIQNKNSLRNATIQVFSHRTVLFLDSC